MRHLPGKRVLIVEDHPVLAFDIQDLVTEAGAQSIGPALDLDTGMDLARNEKIDAALLDIDIAGEFVWPVAEELRRNNVPMIFISSQCETREFPIHFRDHRCIDKPVIRSQVIESLAGTFDG